MISVRSPTVKSREFYLQRDVTIRVFVVQLGEMDVYRETAPGLFTGLHKWNGKE